MRELLNNIFYFEFWSFNAVKQKIPFFSQNASPSRIHFLSFLISFFIIVTLFSCASTEEAAQLKNSVNFMSGDINQFKNEINVKLFNIVKEQESMKKQLMSLSSSVEGRDEHARNIRGKLDELEHQLEVYWKDTKAEINALKTGNIKPPIIDKPAQTPAREMDPKYEATYKEAFDKFQKGSYDEAAIKFSDFINVYPGTPLVSNSYYWLGESYLNLKNYDKAIVSFQEVIDKYPKSDKASRALLSQAEAFNSIKDAKSSKTILKKVIELYPKTEEAAIAERKLRNLGLR
jgi:tol-pal system protein YbgF